MDKKISLVNLSKVPKRRVGKGRIWDGSADIVGDKLTYIVSYAVNVQMKTGIVERKKFVIKLNLLYVAALILMRITEYEVKWEESTTFNLHEHDGKVS